MENSFLFVYTSLFARRGKEVCIQLLGTAEKNLHEAGRQLRNLISHVIPRPVHAIVSCTPDPWWDDKIEEDNYIHANLAWHMSEAGREIELGALLLDVRWLRLRSQIGNLEMVHHDFEFCFHLSGSCDGTKTSEEPVMDAGEAFQYLYRILRVSWGRWYEGERSFQFQVCGRLTPMQNVNQLVNLLLCSIQRYTPKPYLLPVNSFFPHIDKCPLMEVPCRSLCVCVASSRCGKYVAAGDGGDVIVVDVKYGQILKRFKTLSSLACSVSFFPSSKCLILGDADGNVFVWEWKLEIPTVKSLGKHQSRVLYVSSVVEGGRAASASIDGHICLWDVHSGECLKEYRQVGAEAWVPLALGKELVVLCANNDRIKIQDMDNDFCRELDMSESKKGEEFLPICTISADEKYVAVSRNKITFIWETETWNRVGTAIRGWSRAFSSDNTLLAVGDSIDPTPSTTRIVNIQTGMYVWASTVPQHSITAVFTDMDKTLVVVDYDGLLRFWDVSQLEQTIVSVEDIPVPEEPCVALSPDGLIVASLSRTGTISLWSSANGNLVKVIRIGHTAGIEWMLFAPSGTHLLTGGSNIHLTLWKLNPQKKGGARSFLQWVFSPPKRNIGRVISGKGNRILHKLDHTTLKSNDFTLHTCAVFRQVYLLFKDGSNGEERMLIFNRESKKPIWQSENTYSARGGHVPVVVRLPSALSGASTSQEQADIEDEENIFRTEISNESAHEIIDMCREDQQPFSDDLLLNLLPLSTIPFLPDFPDVFSDMGKVFSRTLETGEPIASLPWETSEWFYSEETQAFVAPGPGKPIICTFVTE